MCSPGRNNSDRIGSVGEDNEEYSTFNLADRLATFFTVVAPPIDPFQSVRVRKHACCVSKIKATLPERDITLGVVPLEYHMGGIAV